jgi:hypothetical protein
MSASKSRRSHFLVSVLRIDHTALRGVRWSEVAREHAAGITLRVMIPSSVAIDLPLFAENRNPQKARSFHHVISLQSRRLPCLTRARFRANQNALWQCVGRERMTVLTGGACQLTGLPELAIQILPTGPGSAVRSALRTAPQRQFTTGPAATSRGSEDGFARASPSRTGRGPAGDTRRSIPPAHR